MKKLIALSTVLLFLLPVLTAQQRMRISKGTYKLTQSTNKIPANCIDRTLERPRSSNTFRIATKSIVLTGKSVPEISLQEAIEKGIIEIKGMDSAKEITINVLKSELGYDEINVKNSTGVVGFESQNFDDLARLKSLDKNLNAIDEQYSKLVAKYSLEHPVVTYLNYEKFRIDGMLAEEEYAVATIKLEAEKLLKNVKSYERNYQFYTTYKKLTAYQNHLSDKYPEGNIVTNNFRRANYDIENTLKFKEQQSIKAAIDDLIETTKKKEIVLDQLNLEDYAFLDRYTRDYSLLKNKNIVIEEPNRLSEKEIKKIQRYNKGPFILTKQALFNNFNKPKEKLKFIFVASDNASKNKELYQAASKDQMNTFTKYVKDIKNNPELAPHFEFVSTKEELEQALADSKGFRTITAYHNREDDLLFGQPKSYYAIEDRLTCNSFEEDYWSSSGLESIDFIDPEDVLHSIANLVKQNPNKNEFQLLEFYQNFSLDYMQIQKNRRVETSLVIGNLIIITGTGVMIIWSPTGTIEGEVIGSLDSLGLDSVKINLSRERSEKVIASTWTKNGKYAFKDIATGEYYISIEAGLIIKDGKDYSSDDWGDDELIEQKYIYANVRTEEVDKDNTYIIVKN